MTDDHDFKTDPASAPTRFGRGGIALREAVHRMVAPYFEQARLRTEEVRDETVRLRDETAALRDEAAAARAECAALQGEVAALRSSLEEVSGAVSTLQAETQAATQALSASGTERADSLDERVRGAELELRAVTRRLAEALDLRS